MPPPENKNTNTEGPLHVVGPRVLSGKVDLAITCQKLKDTSNILLEIFGKV